MSTTESYLNRSRQLEPAIDRERNHSRRLSWGRLLVALFGVGGFVYAVVRASTDPAPGYAVLLVAASTFVALAWIHDRSLGRLAESERRLAFNRQGAARIERRWSDLPEVRGAPPESSLAQARDLGTFAPSSTTETPGQASLFRLLAGWLSPPGRARLIDWLTVPSRREELGPRQEGVRYLAARPQVLEDLAIEGGRLAELEPNISDFLAWAEGDPWLLPRTHLRRLSWILPTVTLGAMSAVLVGSLPSWIAAIGLLGQFVLGNVLSGALHRELDRVSHREREMQSYASALQVLEGWRRLSDLPPVLEALLADLDESGRLPSDHLARLHHHLELADARYSGSLHFVLQTLFLWDLHTLRRLEGWQRSNGASVRRWLETLATAECLGALATLAHDEPSWCFPELLSPTETQIEAVGLAHALLPATARVGNDVRLGPPGRFLLVTGSNMSGKSTLLRATGLAIVLAQAGGPVCARSLRLPPVRLASSILVEDSLVDGVSLFLAELLRLRDVVGAARAQRSTERRLVFLLDEILRGTNSRDRHEAVRRVLERLLESGAIGAISTHDVALAEAPDLRPAADCVHFRETVVASPAPGEPPMHFDYTLRPGVSTSTNALALLEWVGFGETGYDDRSAQPENPPEPKERPLPSRRSS